MEISEWQLARNEVQRKIDRRQRLVQDLHRITVRLDKIEEELYAPARHTGQEYDKLVHERSALLIEYENKEKSLKQEFPFKDIEKQLDELSKKEDNENEI